MVNLFVNISLICYRRLMCLMLDPSTRLYSKQCQLILSLDNIQTSEFSTYKWISSIR